MNESQAVRKKRYRGAILQFVHTNREDQGSRMDDIQLWGLLQELNFEVGQNEVLSMLQDLESRQYLRFAVKKNRYSGRTEISQIELTSRGCDLVERIMEDPAVLVP